MNSRAGASADLRRDPYLWFLLIGVPRRFRRWILDDFNKSSFDQANCAEATDILEAGAYVSWIKAAIIGALFGVLAATIPDLHGPVDDIIQVVILTMIMWTPAYIVVVGIAHQILRRTTDPTRRPVTDRTTTLALIRTAPLIGGGMALLIGFTA